jgi:hypothetical protein
MKKLFTIVLLLLSAFAWADKQESVESLKARAGRTQPKERVELCTRIAERQLDALEKAYNDGNTKQARASLADVVTYGVQAADLSSETGKHMKKTEITLRKISGRLEAMRRTLDVDDRPPVAEAVQKIEAARNELLNRMFRK